MTTVNPDDDLLKRMRAGNEEAFAEFVRSHSGRMLVVAKRILRDDEAAADAVQEQLGTDDADIRVRLGLDGEVLTQTVENFNTMVKNGHDDDFGRGDGYEADADPRINSQKP